MLPAVSHMFAVCLGADWGTEGGSGGCWVTLCMGNGVSTEHGWCRCQVAASLAGAPEGFPCLRLCEERISEKDLQKPEIP